MPQPVIADVVREHVAVLAAGDFLLTRDLVTLLGEDARSAIDVALHRQAGDHQLMRIRPGIYARPLAGPGGLRWPPVDVVARAIARASGFDSGVGPTGGSALHSLGLTGPPVPLQVTVPGRAPRPAAGIWFTSRTVTRRGLSWLDVAALEAAREHDLLSDHNVTWYAFVHRIREHVEAGRIDLAAVRAAAGRERHRTARARVAELAADLAGDHLEGVRIA